MEDPEFKIRDLIRRENVRVYLRLLGRFLALRNGMSGASEPRATKESGCRVSSLAVFGSAHSTRRASPPAFLAQPVHRPHSRRPAAALPLLDPRIMLAECAAPSNARSVVPAGDPACLRLACAPPATRFDGRTRSTSAAIGKRSWLATGIDVPFLAAPH